MSQLKIAIQKKGRLHDESLDLLKKCGLETSNGADQLKVTVGNFPLEILYLRNSDIPKYLEDGVVDCAILGENVLIEKNSVATVMKKLGFSKCKVSLAVPKSVEDITLTYLNGKRIATSYPNTLQTFLDKNNISAQIHQISGSVEIAPNIGLAEGICDIVSTGSTLFKNGLKETQVILTSEAVLARSPKIRKENSQILDKLLFRMDAVINSKKSKYILMNVPNDKIEEVSNILPILKSPTVLPLAQKGWSSVHSVISEKTFWEVIDELRTAGAEGILIVPIEKMIL